MSFKAVWNIRAAARAIFLADVAVVDDAISRVLLFDVLLSLFVFFFARALRFLDEREKRERERERERRRRKKKMADPPQKKTGFPPGKNFFYLSGGDFE